MRFAIKTSPQDTRWADMLEVWQAADDIELFESAWTFDHFYPIFSDPTGPCLDVAAIEAQVASADEAGIQLGIVYLPIPHTPSVLEPLAAQLEPLAG